MYHCAVDLPRDGGGKTYVEMDSEGILSTVPLAYAPNAEFATVSGTGQPTAGPLRVSVCPSGATDVPFWVVAAVVVGVPSVSTRLEGSVGDAGVEPAGTNVRVADELPAGNCSRTGEPAGEVVPVPAIRAPVAVSPPESVTGTVQALLEPPLRVTTIEMLDPPIDAADEVAANEKVTSDSGSTTDIVFAKGLPSEPAVGASSVTMQVPVAAVVSMSMDFAARSPSAKVMGVGVALEQVLVPDTLKGTFTEPRDPFARFTRI